MRIRNAELPRTFGLSSCLLLALLIVGSLAADPSLAQPTWSSLEPLPVALSRTAVVVAQTSAGDEILVIGGSSSGLRCTDEVWSWSSQVGWNQATPAPKELCNHAAVARASTVYVMGGSDGPQGSDDVLRFDAVGGSWTPVADMMTERSHHAAVWLPDGRIFVFGGQDLRGFPLDSVEIYDPQRDTWSAGPSLPRELGVIDAVLGCDDRVYLVTGQGSELGTLFLRFDPATESYEELDYLPGVLYHRAVARGSDGKVYAFGGYDFLATDASWAWENGSWSRSTTLPEATGLAAAVAYENRIHLFGGYRKFGGTLDAHYALGDLSQDAACEIDPEPEGTEVCTCPDGTSYDASRESCITSACGERLPGLPNGSKGGGYFAQDQRLYQQVADASCQTVEGTWTPWLNRDRPSGVGDYETLKDFLAAGQACPAPLAIECETVSGTPWNFTGQPFTCDPAVGGFCVNREVRASGGSGCMNYRVRFLCP